MNKTNRTDVDSLRVNDLLRVANARRNSMPKRHYSSNYGFMGLSKNRIPDTHQKRDWHAAHIFFLQLGSNINE